MLAPFVVLAIVSVAALVGSVVVGQRLLTGYSESARSARQWSIRREGFGQLGSLTERIDAPATDVFESRDAERESSRLDSARDAFKVAIRRVHADVDSTLKASERERFVRLVDEFDGSVDAMAADARRVLALVAHGDTAAAARVLAVVQRDGATANAKLLDLRRFSASVQGRQLRTQLAIAQQLHRDARRIVLLALLVVAGLLVYGFRASVTVNVLLTNVRRQLALLASSEERYRTLNSELENKVAARTEQLLASNTRLAASEAELRALISSMSDVVIVFDANGGYKAVFETRTQSLIRPAAEMIGRTVDDTLPPSARSFVRGVIARALESAEPVPVEYSLPMRGRVAWLRGYASPLPDGTVLWVAHDVTTERTATEQLRRRERQLGAAQRIAHLGSWELDTASEVVELSEEAYRIFGLDPDSVAPSLDTIVACAHPDDRARVRQAIDDARTGGAADVLAHRVVLPDGEIRRVRVRFDAAVGSGSSHLVGTVLDITDLMAAKEELRAQRHYLRQVLDTIPNLVFAKDRAGRFTLANQAMADACGTTVDALIGRTADDVIAASDDASRSYRQALAAIDGIEESSTPERCIVGPDGHERWLHAVTRPISMTDDRPEQVLAIVTDITAIKTAQRSMGQLAALVDSSTYPIFSCDDRGVIQTWNPGAEALLGYPASEIVGRHASVLLPPEERGVVDAQLQRFGAGARMPTQFDAKRVCKDGRELDIAVSLAPICGPAGEFKGVSAIYQDVTTRKLAERRLQESTTELLQAQELAHLGSFRQDLTTRRVSWSAEMFEVFGRDPAVFTPTFAGFAESIHPDDRTRVLARISDCVATGEPLHLAFRCIRSDGSIGFIESRAQLIRDDGGRPLWVTGIARDVTEQMRVRAAIEAAREAAESASRAKSEFLANMSHEIRTPMNGVLGMLDLALDGRLDPLLREYLLTARSSAESLLDVINDILDFSKVEAGRLELEQLPFGLRGKLGEALGALALRAAEKGIELAVEFDPDTPDALVGDFGRLRQVVVNLVGNAIKFTDQGEIIIAVRCDAIDDAGVMLHCTVRDTGVGIAADKQELIFESFRQADTSTTREYGGTGLGLAISARLVALMGGRMWVESAPGAGSTFHFTARLERQAAAERGQDLSLGPAAELHGVHVLVVDDNATNLRILEQMLTQWGMHPTLASNGHDALAKLAGGARDHITFELVVTDADMPGMDGFELVERLRSDATFGGTAILMLSSGRHHDEMQRCRAAGVEIYVMKPVLQHQLRDAVTTAMRRVRGAGNVPVTADERSSDPIAPHRSVLRVLIAEDNVVNQRLLRSMLDRMGHDVVVVANGREAVDAVARERFDLVLMDVQMPEMGGFEATRAIRQRETLQRGDTCGRHLPVIAVTARAMAGDREACLAAGMDGYLSKPIRRDQLVLAMADAMRAEQQPSSDGGPAATDDVAVDGAVLDEAALLVAAGGDHRLRAELGELFLREYPRAVLAIKDALGTRDAAGVEFAAHGLKGSAGTIAAARTAAAAGALELHARTGTLTEAPMLVARLERELATLHEQLLAVIR